ncbi:gliding motility-associated C-terminal domain-containing protein [Pedobacter xixiisoli]|uniref:Gliding motility-associated C-terminal domain-containing protein n=1 Tax=Pedobacter xixiisoli TaxID=1476464 RepID=A0A286A930_9SPHI|nr:gliding motility-associated C-terminal domain-containing protein [Pedobacter xixiisoli]SOD18402.1 gliding motility-associated C-terminal domain-containing protein [Pedobacter xixiisoli]
MRKLYVLLLLSALFGIDATAQTIKYVKAGGTGDGSSWAAASGDLQAMINASAASGEVWVAAGTYKPNRRANALETITADDRYNSFVLKKDVSVFGGFSGVETTKVGRDFAANASILSGNLGNQAIDTDNAYHVVIAAGDLGTATLNGFTLTKGYTSGTGTGTTTPVNGINIPISRSPGIVIYSSSPTLENLIISENVNGSTDQTGGATYIIYGSPNFNKVKFVNNRTSGTTAGAVFVFGSAATNSKPVFSEVDFIGNQGSSAGAVAISSSSKVEFKKCNFTGNKSISSWGGALQLFAASADAEVIDCNFADNQSFTSGGAIYNGLAAPLKIINTTFSNNIASNGQGGAISFSSGPLIIEKSTFNGNKSPLGIAGALFLGNSSNVFLLEGNSFKDNEAQKEGGAIYITTSAPLIKNNRFNTNKAVTFGGAIYTAGTTSTTLSTPTIVGNIFYNNQATGTTGTGGAVYIGVNSTPLLVNSTFYANVAADKGGAIGLGNPGFLAKVHNSIIYGNTAADATTIDIYNASTDNLDIQYTLTQNFGTNGAAGNIVASDPEFASVDVNNANFLKLTEDSWAVNAGNNNLIPLGVTTDILGVNRITHSVVDMGALEYDGTLPPPYTVSVDENSPNGTYVGTPTSRLGGTLNWEFFSGNINDAFAVNATTGVITVNKSSELDYETKSLFNLFLKATNNFGLIQNVPVLINLNNLMEKPGTPEITNTKVNDVIISYRPKLRGIAEPVSTITIYVDGVAYATKTSSDPQGNWRLDFLDEVTPGTHAFHVVANNSLGTSEPSNTVTATFKLYTGEVVVNNILTPNGDGKNDLWIAKDLSLMYPQNEAIVYDKTGKVVFKKANYQSDWDGTYNSSPLSTGTYYYEINIGAGLKPLKGTLTILRGR